MSSKKTLVLASIAALTLAVVACSDRIDMGDVIGPDASTPIFTNPNGADSGLDEPGPLCIGTECPDPWATCVSDDGPTYKCGTDLRSDSKNCGACGNECPTYKPIHMTSRCVDSACVVECFNPNAQIDQFDWRNCNGLIDDGCEVDVLNDPKNCGSCGNACAPGVQCPVDTGVSARFTLTSVWGSSKDDVWIGGSGGTIIHWDGTSFKPVPTGLKQTFHVLWGSSGHDIWAISGTDMILHTTGFESGSPTWERVETPVDEYSKKPVFAVWGNGTELRLGTESFYFSDEQGNSGSANQLVKEVNSDGGSAWRVASGSATVNGFWGASPDDLWLIADNSQYVSWQLGMMMHGRRGGQGDLVWAEVDSQSSSVLRGLWGSSAADIWAVGDTGTIRHLGARPDRWDKSASPVTENLRAIWGSEPNDVWAVGDTGTILHWDGAAWTESVAAFPVNTSKPHLYGIWGSGPDDVWIVGDGIALHHVRRASGGGPK